MDRDFDTSSSREEGCKAHGKVTRCHLGTPTASSALEAMKKTLLILVWWALPGPAQDSLSPKDAVRHALAANKSMAVSTADWNAAARRVVEARSGNLPKVNYSESWARSDNPVFVFSSLLTQHQFGEQNFQVSPLNRPDSLNNFQSQLTADQALYDAGQTRQAVRSAELAKDIAKEDGRRTQMAVIASVIRAYYDVLLGAEQLNATNQAMRSAETDLDRAESVRNTGMSTDVDVLSIRVHLANVRERQIRSGADLDVARAALNDAVGIKNRLAGVLVHQVGTENRHGRSPLDLEQLRGGELRFTSADVQRIVIHRCKSPEHIPVFHQIIILVAADCIADIHTQGICLGLGIQHGFEARQPAELAGKTAAGLQPPAGVAGKIHRQIERWRQRFTAASQEQGQAGKGRDARSLSPHPPKVRPGDCFNTKPHR